MNLVLPQKEGHYYDKEGNPVYQVESKSPGIYRPTRVTDALQMDLVSSVTTMIGGVLYRPGLEIWKQSQAIMSALTLPKLEHESMDEFAKRVVVDSRREGEAAAEWGTNAHGLIELFFDNNLPEVLDSVQKSIIDAFTVWTIQHNVQPITLELSFCDWDRQFAGRLDFLGFIDNIFCLVDWKTQGTKPRQKVNFYPEWNTQLSAYKAGINEPEAFKTSVVISSTEPGRIESYTWLDDDTEWGWKSFDAIKHLYYSPLGPGYRIALERGLV